MTTTIQAEWETDDEVKQEKDFILRGITTKEERNIYENLRQKHGNYKFDDLEDDPVINMDYQTELVMRAIKEPREYRNKQKIENLPGKIKMQLFEAAMNLYAPDESKKKSSKQDSGNETEK